jgi:EAL domain-containing protein (putative c-di-GMP-specific phosphodiesterase class I)
MQNYQDHNAFANIFCEFVSQCLNSIQDISGIFVYYIQIDIINKKNLEIYGFDLASKAMEYISKATTLSTQDPEFRMCFIAMDAMILLTKRPPEGIYRDITELCARCYITKDEYISTTCYIGYQAIENIEIEPVELFHKVLMNQITPECISKQTPSDCKIHNARYFRTEILRGNVVFLYQPVFNINANHIEYYECLMRIRHNGEFQSIADFIPAAEELELGPLIDRTAFDLLKNTLVQYPNIKFSFNLTASVIRNSHLIDEIMHLLDNQDIAQRVLVEITETSQLASFNETAQFIELLRKQNVQFVIDDFGSGYTSFHQLKTLSVDVVKIDGSFIQDILSNIVSQNFVQAVVNICKDKNIKVVCEFVETEEVCEYLSNLGVQYMQGYYFGQPRSIAEPGAQYRNN